MYIKSLGNTGVYFRIIFDKNKLNYIIPEVQY
jgi:hypothetical protein